MRTTFLALTLAAAVAAGCGDDSDTEPGAATTQARTQEQQQGPASLDEACAQAARDLQDPVAFERRLPKSPVPTSSTEPGAKREAAALRGTKEIVQRVYDAATDPEHRAYRASLRALIQQLDDAELVVRQDYEVGDIDAQVRARWRRAERAAPAACRKVRQPR